VGTRIDLFIRYYTLTHCLCHSHSHGLLDDDVYRAGDTLLIDSLKGFPNTIDGPEKEIRFHILPYIDWMTGVTNKLIL
jgi:hypothetical protein